MTTDPYTPEQITERLTAYFQEQPLYHQPHNPLTPETNLIQAGFIDSMGVMQLILFLEEAFKLTIQPNEIAPANFETIKALQTLVLSKINT